MMDTYIIASGKMDARPLFPEDTDTHTQTDIQLTKTQFTSSSPEILIVHAVDVCQPDYSVS